MKWSNTILITATVIGLTGMFASNAVIKKEYERLDKSDPYWNFTKILDKPFHHLAITGGNVSNIVYEQSPHSSVKILRAWRGATDGTVKADVKNDTLHIQFANHYNDTYEKYWLKDAVTLRISGPEVQSVTGFDTKLYLNKFNQPRLYVNMSGNSKLLVNSYRNNFDKIDVMQKDSSVALFIMSNEIIGPDAIAMKEVTIKGTGQSLVNLRTSSIEQLSLDLADSASVALSGYTLDKWNLSRSIHHDK